MFPHLRSPLGIAIGNYGGVSAEIGSFHTAQSSLVFSLEQLWLGFLTLEFLSASVTVSSEAKNLRFTGGLLGSELLASGDFALDLVAHVTSATDRSALELPSYRTAASGKIDCLHPTKIAVTYLSKPRLTTTDDFGVMSTKATRPQLSAASSKLQRHLCIVDGPKVGMISQYTFCC